MKESRFNFIMKTDFPSNSNAAKLQTISGMVSKVCKSAFIKKKKKKAELEKWSIVGGSAICNVREYIPLAISCWKFSNCQCKMIPLYKNQHRASIHKRWLVDCEYISVSA